MRNLPNTLGNVLCSQHELTQEKSPVSRGQVDGDVFIQSGQIGFEQMSHVADRVTDLCRDGVIWIDR